MCDVRDRDTRYGCKAKAVEVVGLAGKAMRPIEVRGKECEMVWRGLARLSR